MTDSRLPAIPAGSKVQGIIPTDFDSAYRIAQAVCVAGMAPKDLSSPERAFVAIMHGLEVGLPPMQALQSIAVINGRPSIWGDGALGLVRSSGICDYIHERIEGGGDERVAICEAKRRGEDKPVVGRFSVADAKLAGLWGKKGRDGQPTPWVTYPDRMLQMRARAWALRDGFADVLRGLHIAEEMADIPAESNKVQAPSPDEQRKKATDRPPERAEPIAATQEPQKPEATQRASLLDDAVAAKGGDLDALKRVGERMMPPKTEFYTKHQKVIDPNPVVVTRFLDGTLTPAEPFDVWKWLDDLSARFLACKTVEDVAGVWDDALSRKDEVLYPSDWQEAEKMHETAKAKASG